MTLGFKLSFCLACHGSEGKLPGFFPCIVDEYPDTTDASIASHPLNNAQPNLQ